MATKYENYITGDDTSDPIQDVYWCWAQAFTPITTHRITSVKFKGYRVGSPGTITAKIMNFSELPNGAYLCSGEYNGNILPLVAGWFEVTLGDGCVVTVGQQYRIQLYAPGVTETDYMGLRIDITAPTYSGGRLWWGYLAGNGWYSLYGGIEIDAMFEEWGHAVSAGNADVILECAFNQSTFVDPDLATWTDVTPELMSLNTHRGRQHALDRIEAGTASFIMDNQSGNWWRYNTAGAYYGTTGDVKPLTPIRLRPYYGGTQYPLWYGMIEKIVPSWLEEGGYVPIAELQCVDLFKSLALFNLNQNLLLANASSGQKVIVVSRAIGLSAGQSIYIIDTEHNESRIIDTIVGNTITFTANLTNAYTTAKGAYTSFGLELSGARIGHILDVLGWPTAARIIDTGQNYVIGLPIPTGGIKALEHLQNVTESEGGLLFQGRDSKMVFQDALARQEAPLNSPLSTFSDDGTHSKYVLPELADDESFIRNEADISGPGITNEIIVKDDALQVTQGPRAVVRKDSLLISQAVAFDQALELVLRYSDSILRVDNLLLLPDGSPADLYPKIFGYEISDRITLELNSTRNPAIINEQYHIEAIEHQWAANTGIWSTKWQLWDVSKYRLFSTIPHDGYLVKEDAVYLTAHDAAVSDSAENDAHAIGVGQLNNGTGISDDFFVWRGYLEIDTILFLATETAASGNLILHIDGPFTVNTAFDLRIVPAIGVHQPVVVGDFDDMHDNQTNYGSVTIASGKYNENFIIIPLTPAGITALTKEGITKFGLRSSRDIAGTSPGTPGPKEEWLSFYGKGTDFPPRLLLEIS